MPKQNKDFAQCPCCKSYRYKSETEQAISDLVSMDQKTIKYIKLTKSDHYQSLINGQYDWACDLCLNSKQAIKAQPQLQNYCWNPYLAYYDSELTCQSCQTNFVFSKEEKKYWYEELQFWIDSIPKNCVNCRKTLRELKKENQALSKILRKPEPHLNEVELRIVIEIYKKWNKENRAKYYQSVLKKNFNKKTD